MNAPLALFMGCIVGAFLGFGFADDAHQRREIARAALKPRLPQPMQAAQILQCPVTPHSLAEYYRTCRGRVRSDSIKPKGETK